MGLYRDGNIYGQIAGMYYALSDYHFLNDDGSTSFNDGEHSAGTNTDDNFGGFDREGCINGNVVGVSIDGIIQVMFRYNPIYQSPPECVASWKLARGEQNFFGSLGADIIGQELDIVEFIAKAQLCRRYTKSGGVGGDLNIAKLRYFQAATDAEPGDPGDGWFWRGNEGVGGS